MDKTGIKTETDMTKKHLSSLALAACLAGTMMIPLARAHFQMVIPSETVIEGQAKNIDLQYIFNHPFEGKVLVMARPRSCGVMVGGKKIDLMPKLKAVKYKGKPAWQAKYKIKKPGVYTFFVDPAPYWEPAENKYIVHFAKTVVLGLGGEGDWSALVGFPIEIRPLARPYAIWSGAVFVGQVVRKKGGQYVPVPGAEVEVEYWARGKIKAANEELVTYVVKADGNGVFTVGLPKAGWWGFAALVDAPIKIKGKKVEWGGVLWVKTFAW
jgi:cobalt/nickel transport protein